MDYKRYLLIGSIAVLSFMLLTEWVQFKERTNTANDVSSYQPPTTSTVSNNTDAMINNLPSDINEETADIPSLDQPEPSHDITPVAAGNKIRIFTDTLDVSINKSGGDIVQAALTQYFAKIDNPDIPFTLLEDSNQRTYVAQSGLIGVDGIDTSKGRAQFSTHANEYRMQEGQDELIVDLIFSQNTDVNIIKRFRFTRGEYLIHVEYLIDNQSNKPWSASMFGQLKRDNSPDPSQSSSGMGLSPYLGAAINLPDESYKKVSFSDIEEKKFAKQNIEGGWVAIVQHYFTSAWIPEVDKTHTYSMLKAKDQSNIVRFTGPQVTINPGQTGKISAQLYTGPKNQYRLEEISPGLELTVDYGILWWIAQPLFWLLTKLHGYLGNWGFAIIGVTILVKLLFFQLNAKAYTSMANMRKVQPKLTALRERYADDKQKQSQEMMALYKKEKINPLGGCLPILVQMPVFMALYWVLMESVELRQAPFIGYIRDLSVMDPYFILPLIMGVSMFIQQSLNPPPPDPMQAKVMKFMPVMFTFFFLFFPAGLVLYWVVNNTLSIIQQYIITKRIEKS
ncbi:MAG: membrane protein insertase YidC [Spongiibacteraceae bacterium]